MGACSPHPRPPWPLTLVTHLPHYIHRCPPIQTNRTSMGHVRRTSPIQAYLRLVLGADGVGRCVFVRYVELGGERGGGCGGGCAGGDVVDVEVVGGWYRRVPSVGGAIPSSQSRPCASR